MFTPRLSAYERQIIEERRARLRRMSGRKEVMNLGGETATEHTRSKSIPLPRSDAAPHDARPTRACGALEFQAPTISPGLIRRQIMFHFGIDEEQLRSEKYGSGKKYVMARFLSMYLCVEYFPSLSKNCIAKMHGGRGHSTVYYALHVLRWCINGVPPPENVKTRKWGDPEKMAAMKAPYEAIKATLDAILTKSGKSL